MAKERGGRQREGRQGERVNQMGKKLRIKLRGKYRNERGENKRVMTDRGMRRQEKEEM